MTSPGGLPSLVGDASPNHQRADSQATLVAGVTSIGRPLYKLPVGDNHEDAVLNAQRFRVTAEPATEPAKPSAGSPSAAAPCTHPVFTAAALAVVDKPDHVADGPDEVPSNVNAHPVALAGDMHTGGLTVAAAVASTTSTPLVTAPNTMTHPDRAVGIRREDFAAEFLPVVLRPLGLQLTREGGTFIISKMDIPSQTPVPPSVLYPPPPLPRAPLPLMPPLPPIVRPPPAPVEDELDDESEDESDEDYLDDDDDDFEDPEDQFYLSDNDDANSDFEDDELRGR